MDLVSYIILGIIQGITEFLPVSSSGHLIILKGFLDIPQSLAVDTTLHFATLLAVVFYYKNKIVNIARSYYVRLVGKDVDQRDDFKLGNYILVATIPTVIAGMFFLDFFESLRNIGVVTVMLFLVAVYMLVADHLQIKKWKVKVNKKATRKITLWVALLIGIAQVVALVPGTSRSGITIATAVLFGVQKEEAAEFSFLLSLPAVLGASILGVFEVGNVYTLLNINILISFFAALVSGYLSIRFLISILKRYNFKPFVVYRILLVFLLLFIF